MLRIYIISICLNPSVSWVLVRDDMEMKMAGGDVIHELKNADVDVDVDVDVYDDNIA